MNLKGIEKSAILLMAIGADQASKILKYLTSIEVQELVTYMLNVNKYSNTTLNQILTECYNIFMNNNNVVYHDNDKYISNILTKVLGEKQKNILLNDVLAVRNIKMSIESLNLMKPNELGFLLQNEHYQIITTILVYLNPTQAAKVISFFNEQQRIEIIIKISKFNGLEENQFIELKNIIDNLLKKKRVICSHKNGIKTAANILNAMHIKHEKNLLNQIRISNKKVSDKIIQEIFSFENILDISDNVIQHLIHHIEEEKLYIALQNTSENIRNKFFKNMDKDKLKKLLIHLEKKSYVSFIAINNEQKLILMMIKNILDHGMFSIENLGQYYV